MLFAHQESRAYHDQILPDIDGSTDVTEFVLARFKLEHPQASLEYLNVCHRVEVVFAGMRTCQVNCPSSTRHSLSIKPLMLRTYASTSDPEKVEPK